MAKRTVSDPKKPILDEQTLDRLLEAACVIQEQGDLQRQTRHPATADQIPPAQFSTNKVPATLIASSSVAPTRSSVVEKIGAEKGVAEKAAGEKPVSSE